MEIPWNSETSKQIPSLPGRVSQPDKVILAGVGAMIVRNLFRKFGRIPYTEDCILVTYLIHIFVLHFNLLVESILSTGAKKFSQCQISPHPIMKT